MADPKPAHLRVKINGANVEGTVQSVDVEDHDRLIDRARIVIDDAKGQYRDAVLENQPVLVELGWEDEKALLFEGILQKPQAETRGGSHQRLTLTAFDRSYLLKQRKKPADKPEFKGKLSEIVKQVMERDTPPKHGIVVDPVNIKPEPDPALEFVQPAYMDDWTLIQKLAIEHGCRAFVEVNEDQSKFYFVSEKSLLAADPMGQMNICHGFSKVLDFTYKRIASGAVRKALVALDDPKTGEPFVGESAPEAAGPEPAVNAETRANVAKNGGTGAANAYDTAVDNAKKQELKPEEQVPKEYLQSLPSDPDLASKRINRDPTRVLGLFGEGTCVGTVKLRAKGRVTITGIATWAEGDWYVIRCNHVYTRQVQDKKDASIYRTRFAVTR